MNGKAEILLKDAKSGRLVKRLDEKNMVTNALRDILSPPASFLFSHSTIKPFENYLPIYAALTKGVALFSENIPENAADYMINGRFGLIASAGSGYTGADVMRGTFNSNQSGEINGGYRFVWDFAPEKACGVIKSIALTSLNFANIGDPLLNTSGSALMGAANALDTQGSYNITNFTGYFFGTTRDNCFCYYSGASGSVNIRKYKFLTPNAVRVLDDRAARLESEANIQTPFSTLSSYCCNFYDSENEKLWFMYRDTYSGHLRIKYFAVDMESLSIVSQGEATGLVDTIGNVSHAAVFGGKLYTASSRTLRVYTLGGTLLSEIPTAFTACSGFFVSFGKLALQGGVYSTSKSGFALVCDDGLHYNSSLAGLITKSRADAPPFFLEVTGNSSRPVLRSDYLATINNLSEPLEKTDRHALQIRYELTN